MTGSWVSLAQRIYERAHLTGEFRLRSGSSSREYFDKYRFESDPVLLREIARGIIALLPSEIDALAGLELGGVPIATVVSQLSDIPALSCANRPKRTARASWLKEEASLAGGWWSSRTWLPRVVR